MIPQFLLAKIPKSPFHQGTWHPFGNQDIRLRLRYPFLSFFLKSGLDTANIAAAVRSSEAIPEIVEGPAWYVFAN